MARAVSRLRCSTGCCFSFGGQQPSRLYFPGPGAAFACPPIASCAACVHAGVDRTRHEHCAPGTLSLSSTLLTASLAPPAALLATFRSSEPSLRLEVPRRPPFPRPSAPPKPLCPATRAAALRYLLKPASPPSPPSDPSRASCWERKRSLWLSSWARLCRRCHRRSPSAHKPPSLRRAPLDRVLCLVYAYYSLAHPVCCTHTTTPPSRL